VVGLKTVLVPAVIRWTERAARSGPRPGPL